MPTSALFAASFLFATEPTIAVMRMADGRVTRRLGPVVAPAAPGSTVKPLTLAAWLEKPKFDPAKRIACPGRLTLGGRRFDCSHGAVLPAANASEAIAYSCNRYFAHWARELGGASWAAFGLRAQTPDSAEEQAMQAMGEWGIAVTPEQLAGAYRELALREKEPGLAPVFAGLREACVRGTAQAAGAEFAGKTGTAATARRRSLQAWFAGFTPAVKPETVVVVYVPHGRGALDAAPLARRALA